MRRLAPITTVLVSFTALASPRSELADKLATRTGLVAALADPVHVHGLLFRDLECSRFSHPQDVRGADRDKLADCLMALRPMASDMATDAFVALALHLEVFDENSTHIAGRELIALQLRGDRVVAIGGASAVRGKDADLATYEQRNSDQVEPTPAAKAAIDKTGHDAVTWIELCHDAAGTVTSRAIVAPSGVKAYDDQVLAQFASITAGMREWRFKPYLVGGNPAPVCTAATFIYSP